MSLDEFSRLVEQTGVLLTEQLLLRDIAIHFNQGLMLHKNELDSDEHLQATYLEFLEA